MLLSKIILLRCYGNKIIRGTSAYTVFVGSFCTSRLGRAVEKVGHVQQRATERQGVQVIATKYVDAISDLLTNRSVSQQHLFSQVIHDMSKWQWCLKIRLVNFVLC